jgi:hypothetical protein
MTQADKRDTNPAGTKKADHEHPPYVKQSIWLVTTAGHRERSYGLALNDSWHRTRCEHAVKVVSPASRSRSGDRDALTPARGTTDGRTAARSLPR